MKFPDNKDHFFNAGTHLLIVNTDPSDTLLQRDKIMTWVLGTNLAVLVRIVTGIRAMVIAVTVHILTSQIVVTMVTTVVFPTDFAYQRW